MFLYVLEFFIYYGVSGHGKGIVDAMSSFGVKEPLRKEIVQKDFWHTSSKDIFNFLSKEKANEKMMYYHLPNEELEERRKNCGKFPIDGCRKLHMIAFFPNGADHGHQKRPYL